MDTLKIPYQEIIEQYINPDLHQYAKYSNTWTHLLDSIHVTSEWILQIPFTKSVKEKLHKLPLVQVIEYDDTFYLLRPISSNLSHLNGLKKEYLSLTSMENILSVVNPQRRCDGSILTYMQLVGNDADKANYILGLVHNKLSDGNGVNVFLMLEKLGVIDD